MYIFSIWIYIYIYLAYEHIYIYIHIYTYTYIIHTCMYGHVYMCINIHMCVCHLYNISMNYTCRYTHASIHFTTCLVHFCYIVGTCLLFPPPPPPPPPPRATCRGNKQKAICNTKAIDNRQ